MDIYQWLDDTTKAAQEQTLHGDNPAPCQPHSTAKRRRPSSDDSLVGPLITSQADASVRRTSGKRQQHAPSISSQSLSGSASNCSSSALSTSSSSCSQAPEEIYVRRPRHKTKPDKYDVVSHKQGKAERKVKKHGKDDTRKRKRKTEKEKKQKRKKTHDAKGPIRGLVQAFQARNISKDRITVSNSCYLKQFSKLIVTLL